MDGSVSLTNLYIQDVQKISESDMVVGSTLVAVN